MKRLYILLLLILPMLGSCSEPQGLAPVQTTPPDTVAKVITFRMESRVGTEPFVLGAVYKNTAGVDYRVDLLRFYTGAVILIDSAGREISARLVDTSGNLLQYNLMLFDQTIDSTHAFHLLARPGVYTGMRFAIGVPLIDYKGDSLNHTDAAEHQFPLNIDADMYWGWKPGYIHFKLEGKAIVGATTLPFYFHIGEDHRVMTIALDHPFTVSKTASLEHTLNINIDRIFVTPNGTMSPNPSGDLRDRLVNSGAMADTVAANVSESGFISWGR